MDTVLGRSSSRGGCNFLREKTDEGCEINQNMWAVVQGGHWVNDGGYADGSTHTYNEGSSISQNSALAFGLDQELDNNLMLGWSLGHTLGFYSVPDRWTSGKNKQVNMGFYAAKTFENGFYLTGVAAFGHTDYEQTRFALGREVNGDFSSRSVGGKLELGLHTRKGITPFASYQFDKQTREEFSEDDATWGNKYYTQKTYTREAAFGLEFEADDTLGSGNTITSKARLYGTYDFATGRSLTGSSLAAPDFSYTVTGLNKDASQLHFDLALEAQVSKATTLGAEINLLANGTYTGASASVSFQSRF